MPLYMLSGKDGKDISANYGDCIVVINNGKAVIFDCGSEYLAQRAVSILSHHNIKKATAILSHNDDDHYKGFPYLINNGYVDCLFTIDARKYRHIIEKRINDDRRNPDSILRAIEDVYDNITEAARKAIIKDIYDHYKSLPDFVTLIGPSRNYFIDAVSKRIDNRESDNINKTTIINAASIQLEVRLGNTKVLLTGDCAVDAIPKSVNLRDYDYIQLPHHGNYEMAEEVFDRNKGNYDTVYLISDNTGNSNGGSSELKRKNYKLRKVKTTHGGDITIENNSRTRDSYISGKSLAL